VSGVSARAARWGLAALTLVNLLNYLDRFVAAALFESLRQSELRLGDAELGSLMTSFILVYMLASPVFAALADRGASRTRLLAVGVLVWSAATFLSGLAQSYGQLLLARAAVGIGEAAYGTVSPALLADYYPKAQRGRVFAIFYSAIPVGSALGYVLGGLVDRLAGWRAAFYIAGLPGALLAVATLFLLDPPRGAQDEEAPAPARGAYRRLLRNRPYLLTVIGYAAYTFAMGGMAAWMPAFLERVRGLPRAEATVTFGAVVVVTGFAGTFAGGWLGDALLGRLRQAYLWLSGVATLAAAPLALAVFASSSPAVAMGAMVAAQLLMFASTGPINSAIVNEVGPGERATAVALSILAIHALGDVPSPWLVGVLSDAAGLGRAVLLMPVAILVSGAVWVYAAWAGERRAPPS
jgi:MFS transporter, Spinster family, sphingosine-1-phosphate transporter